SQERKVTVLYEDDSSTAVDLPEEGINKFLDSIVTVSNKEAHRVKLVTIAVPGPMEQWNCVIVDTPGVNDLDEMREEVTYNYLRNADACIVLLDSQQPLSESERRFLEEKVLM